MTITTIHHVQITVPVGRESDARSFYCGVLDLAEIEKPDSLKQRGGLWVRVGDCELHIGIEDGIDRNKTKAHVAFQVDNALQWRDRLAANGITPADSISIPGYDRFEFRDPFGNRVELIQLL